MKAWFAAALAVALAAPVAHAQATPPPPDGATPSAREAGPPDRGEGQMMQMMHGRQGPDGGRPMMMQGRPGADEDDDDDMMAGPGGADGDRPMTMRGHRDPGGPRQMMRPRPGPGGERGPGRHHRRPMGGHHMGKGFELRLPDGGRLRVQCGNEPMESCVDAAAPLLDLLGGGAASGR